MVELPGWEALRGREEPSRKKECPGSEVVLVAVVHQESEEVLGTEGLPESEAELIGEVQESVEYRGSVVP